MSDERKEAARWLAARATDWEAKLIGVPNWLARHEEWMTKLIAFGGIAPSPAAATTEDDDAIEEAFERTKPAPVERGERRVRQTSPCRWPGHSGVYYWRPSTKPYQPDMGCSPDQRAPKRDEANIDGLLTRLLLLDPVSAAGREAKRQIVAAFTRERSLREEAERQRDRLATKLAKVGVWSTRYRDDAVMWRKFDDALKFSGLPTHDGFTRWPEEGRCQDAAKLAANPAPAVACEERRVRQQKPVPLEFGTFGYIRKDSEHTDGAHYDQRRREAGVMTKDVAADVLAFWMLPFDMPPLEQTEARNAIKAAILTLTRSDGAWELWEAARVVDASPLASAERVIEAAKEMSTEVYCSHLDILVDSQEAIVDCECAGCRSRRRFDQSLREYREGGK